MNVTISCASWSSACSKETNKSILYHSNHTNTTHTNNTYRIQKETSNDKKVIGVLNVLTGLFVEAAMQSAQKDHTYNHNANHDNYDNDDANSNSYCIHSL